MPLKIQLLPTSKGDRSQLQPLTTFLVNDTIAIDAGSLGFGLVGPEIARIHHVIITHSHMDHIASLPMAIAGGYVWLKETMRVYATAPTLKAVRANLFNEVVWPDFSRFPVPNSKEKSMDFVEIQPRQSFELDGVRFTPIPVTHEVPTIGLIVEDADSAVVFTSDTTCTDEIWAAASQRKNLKAVFIDCSFPDELEKLAISSGHLTPALVEKEVKKLNVPARTFCIHLKPEVREQVLPQIKPENGLEVMEIGKTYTF